MPPLSQRRTKVLFLLFWLGASGWLAPGRRGVVMEEISPCRCGQPRWRLKNGKVLRICGCNSFLSQAELDESNHENMDDQCDVRRLQRGGTGNDDNSKVD